MKFFLRNIAQSSNLRTILSIVLGLAIWVYAALLDGFSWPLFATAIFVVVNAFQMSYLFSQLGFTNLLTTFVGLTYFLLASALMPDYSAWDTQLCVFGFQSILLLLNTSYEHKEMVEQSFLSTLIVALMCFLNPICAVLLLMVWLVLIFRLAMTLRVFLASLIAILLVLLYAFIFHQLSWIDCSWSTLWARWSNFSILYSLGTFFLAAFIAWLPIKHPSVATGIIYLLSLLSAATTYLLLSL